MKPIAMITVGALLALGTQEAAWVFRAQRIEAQEVVVLRGERGQGLRSPLRQAAVNVLSFIPASLHAGILQGTNTTDLSPYLQAAIDAGIAEIQFPEGSYRIENTVTLGGGSRLFGTVGFGSRLLWYGAAGGTMLDVAGSQQQSIENLNVDGRGVAGVLVQVGRTSVVRGFSMDSCILVDAQESGIVFGDYTNTGQDADVAQVTLRNVIAYGCRHGITVDSINALGINLTGCFLSHLSGTTNVEKALYLKRGGSVYAYGTYFGGQPAAGNEYAVHVVDGWVALFGCEFEWGQGGGGGGCLHLDVPQVPPGSLSSQGRHTSTLVNCRVLSPGVTGSGAVIRIDSDFHSLVLQSNFFNGKSGGSLATYAIRDPGKARVTSLENTYFGYPWSGTDEAWITSIRDQFFDGSDFHPMSARDPRATQITAADSPYFVARQDDTVEVTSGAVVVNLPKAGARQDGGWLGRRLAILRSERPGAVTVQCASGDTIEGVGATFTMAELRAAGLTIESDGFNTWKILSFAAPTPAAPAATGAGTVRMGGAAAATNAGWVEVSPGKYVPYWTNPAP